ncbi:MAG: hypothetical protein ACPW60_09210 [Methylohalobius sp. ZOD2]
MTAKISLQPVTHIRHLTEFIRLPYRLYGNDPHWIPPLRLERSQLLSRKNPYFSHAHWQGWLAWRGSRPVGRISAQIDELYLEQHHRKVGFFGMLEAVDDEEVFARLLAQAESWLKKEGMESIQGPFNLSINHECGLLVDGFQQPPMIMMPYNPPYYADQLEKHGYRKAQDLLAYLLSARTAPPEGASQLAAKAAETIRVRPLDRPRLTEEFELLRSLFNDAWRDNWGFIPFTRAEFQEMGKMLSHIVPDDFVQIAEMNGEAVGMIAAMPDLNQLLSGLDGRLLPFNWLKLLWRWKTAYPDAGRVMLMGIPRKWQQNLLGAAIAYRLIEALRLAGLAQGMRQMELSWILEDNTRIRGIIENLGAACYKRYRIYAKTLP